MAVSDEEMRILLLVCCLGIAVIASLSLRERSLSWFQWIIWVLIILLIPLVGPFLVILLRPGRSKSREPASLPFPEQGV